MSQLINQKDLEAYLQAGLATVYDVQNYLGCSLAEAQEALLEFAYSDASENLDKTFFVQLYSDDEGAITEFLKEAQLETFISQSAEKVLSASIYGISLKGNASFESCLRDFDRLKMVDGPSPVFVFESDPSLFHQNGVNSGFSPDSKTVKAAPKKTTSIAVDLSKKKALTKPAEKKAAKPKTTVTMAKFSKGPEAKKTLEVTH